MESSTTSQPNHPYSLVNRINLDMDVEENMFSQDYNYNQDYSMGYGSGHGSAHDSAHGSAPVNDDVEDDSPVEEVSPVKPKKPSRRAARAKKDALKDRPKDWTVAEETALCQAWCDVSENNIAGNKQSPRLDRRKKPKTSETTSESASGGIDLNDEADEETEELRPMGRDRSKAKKKSTGSSRVRSSSFVDLNRELSIREAEVQQAAQLKRKKLEIQRRTLELAERDKRDKDIIFYNSEISSSLPPIQQQKLLEIN
ncbi:hypothetical protein Tco_0753053 [Tanacetum coccineum]